MITNEDVKKRGYDLTASGRLIQGDFKTIQDACNQFIEECCNSIWALIEKHRGFEWVIKFKQDMSKSLDENELAYYIRERLKTAMIEQVVFVYENGDYNASGIIDTNRRAISPKALGILYTIGILRY